MKEKVNIYLNPLELPTSTLVVSTGLDRFWLPKHCHPWDHDSRVGIFHFSPFSTISIVFFFQWSSRSRTNLDHLILIVRYIYELLVQLVVTDQDGQYTLFFSTAFLLKILYSIVEDETNWSFSYLGLDPFSDLISGSVLKVARI